MNGRSGHFGRVGRIVAPDVRHLRPGNAQVLRRLGAEILRNDREAAVGHRLGVVAAVDDGAPTIGMAVAVDHAQHGQADVIGIGTSGFMMNLQSRMSPISATGSTAWGVMVFSQNSCSYVSLSVTAANAAATRRNCSVSITTSAPTLTNRYAHALTVAASVSTEATVPANLP